MRLKFPLSLLLQAENSHSHLQLLDTIPTWLHHRITNQWATFYRFYHRGFFLQRDVTILSDWRPSRSVAMPLVSEGNHCSGRRRRRRSRSRPKPSVTPFDHLGATEERRGGAGAGRGRASGRAGDVCKAPSSPLHHPPPPSPPLR